MNLIFHDRRPLPTVPTGDAWLTIERKGTFSFSIAAMALLRLQPTDEVVLAEDTETNAWYLVLDPTETVQAFELRPRDKTSKALMFCCQPRARAYYASHGLGQQKSVRSIVSATAIEHQGLKLYPLLPQHSTKKAAPSTLVAESSTPAEVAEQPDVAPLPSDLPHLQDEQPAAPPMVAHTRVLTPGALPESRAEQLADYWNEREVTKAEPHELADIIAMLAAVPKYDRDFTQNKVLNQAKTELAKRNKEKGGKRG